MTKEFLIGLLLVLIGFNLLLLALSFLGLALADALFMSAGILIGAGYMGLNLMLKSEVK